jgi:hypothetical protein
VLGITDIIAAPPAPDASDATSSSDALLESSVPDAPEVEAGPESSTMDAGDASLESSVPDAPEVEAGPESSTMDAGDASACTQDLKNIGTGAFSISFTLKTTQPDPVIALANQRSVCSNGVYWDIRLVNGFLYIEISDFQTGLVMFTSPGSPLNDGAAHDIVVRRALRKVLVTVDGKVSTAGMANQSFDDTLVPLRTGKDVCVGTDKTLPLDATLGGIANLCVKPE